MRRGTRNDPDVRKSEQQRDTTKRRATRTDPEVRLKEQLENTQLRSLAREDLEYARVERNRDRTSKQTRRKDVTCRERENKREADRKRKLYENIIERQRKQSVDASSKALKRKLDKEQMTDVEFAIQKFRQEIKKGPINHCVSCDRLLQDVSLKIFDEKSYSEASKNCWETSSGTNYICTTCHNYLRKSEIPPLSRGNNMGLSSVPPELQNLCPLEQTLLALKIPFMKMISLPRGSQRALHGAVINVLAHV